MTLTFNFHQVVSCLDALVLFTLPTACMYVSCDKILSSNAMQIPHTEASAHTCNYSVFQLVNIFKMIISR